MPSNNHILHSLLTFSIFSYLQAAPQTALWLTCSNNSECPPSSPEWPIYCCVAPADLKPAKKTCRPASYCVDGSYDPARSFVASASEPLESQSLDCETRASEPLASEPLASEPRASEPLASEPRVSESRASEPPAQSDPTIYEYLTKAMATLSFSETGDFKRDCLENHNILRRLMGRTTLVWDDTLAKQAQIYSKDLANRNAFEHSNKTLKPFGLLGENLYKITRTSTSSVWDGKFVPNKGILAWFNEFPLYAIGTKIGSDPVAFKEYGHFTQMQYPTLTKVGCGIEYYKFKVNETFVFTCNYDVAQTTGEILDMSIPSPRPFGL